MNNYDQDGFKLYFYDDSIVVNDGDDVIESNLTRSVILGSNKYGLRIKTIIEGDKYDHEQICLYTNIELTVDIDLALKFFSNLRNLKLKFELIDATIVIIGNNPFVELSCNLR